MIPKNTKRVLHYLLKNLELVNINQISRILKISVGSAFKILKMLEGRRIVISKKMGNSSFYQINLDNEEAFKICELMLIEEKTGLKGYPKIYAEDIKKFKDAELIILFGSVLSSNNFNDIDALFVTNKIKKVNSFCLSLSKIRTKPITPFILKRKDLINEIKNKKEVVLNLIKTGVVLKGEEIYLEVIKNAKS